MANSKLEKSLGLIRKKIDLIDDQMLSFLEERVSLVIDAENLKKNTSKGPYHCLNVASSKHISHHV